MRVDLASGEAIAGGDVREAHEGVHQGALAGVIKPQSWNAFSRRSNGRFGEPSPRSTNRDPHGMGQGPAAASPVI